MSDPHFDQRLSDPVTRRSDDPGDMWGWIAGISVVVLIAIILIAGWNSNSNTASNNAPPATTGSATKPMTPPTTTGQAPRPMTPPTTTGQGPRPMTPSTPAPSPSQQ